MRMYREATICLEELGQMHGERVKLELNCLVRLCSTCPGPGWHSLFFCLRVMQLEPNEHSSEKIPLHLVLAELDLGLFWLLCWPGSLRYWRWDCREVSLEESSLGKWKRKERIRLNRAILWLWIHEMYSKWKLCSRKPSLFRVIHDDQFYAGVDCHSLVYSVICWREFSLKCLMVKGEQIPIESGWKVVSLSDACMS